MLNELKGKSLSGAGAIIWIIDSVLWKIHNCGSIMSAITANGEFSNEGQIKRKPSMFYISVVASISAVIESMPVHTYLRHMLIFVLVSELSSGGILPQGLSWDRARNRANSSWASRLSLSPWDGRGVPALILFHPPSSSFHTQSFHPFPPQERSGTNCSGWREVGTDVTTCCMCLSSHGLLKRHFIF